MKSMHVLVVAVIITVVSFVLTVLEQAQKSPPTQTQSAVSAEQQVSAPGSVAQIAKRLSELESKDLDKGIAGNFPEARQHLSDALTISPHDTPVKQRLRIADDVLAGRIQRKAAIRLFQAASHGAKETWDKAVDAAREAIAIEPRYAEGYIILAASYAQKSMIDEAIAASERAISFASAKPVVALAHGNLGLEYAAKGMLDKALEESNQAVSLDPDLAEAHVTIGQVYIRRGKQTEAIAALEKSIAINPYVALPYAAIANAYSLMGKQDQALTALKMAVTIDPQSGAAHNNLAVLYYNKGDDKSAIMHLDRAVELGYQVNPQLVEALRPRR